MLFVIFGATLDMGYESRRIFREKGFHIIQKYNYVSDDAKVDKSKYENASADENYAKWFDDKVYVEEDQLASMDFRYNLDGVYLGFNQTQIMDAVRGVHDALITVGGSTLKLMTLLKKAYGDYITIINLYESDAAVIASTQYDASMTEKEKATRIAANQKMQKLFLENRSSFDEIVLYTGEHSLYDMQALEAQYDNIINKRKELEKTLNNNRYVALPYSGGEPYAFISYAHADITEVFSVMAAIQRNGCRVWYDDGIVGGSNWQLILKEKIEGADAFILFLSETSIQSPYVKDEIEIAHKSGVPIFPISLDSCNIEEKVDPFIAALQILDVGKARFEQRILEALPDTIRMS